MGLVLNDKQRQRKVACKTSVVTKYRPDFEVIRWNETMFGSLTILSCVVHNVYWVAELVMALATVLSSYILLSVIFCFLLSWLVDFCLPFDGDAILLCTLLVFFSFFVATLSLLMTEYTLYIAIVAFSECNRVIRVRFILGVLSANNTKCYFTSFPRRARSHIWFLWMEFLVIVFFPYFSSLFLRAFFHALPWYVFSSYCCCCCCRCSNSCSSPFFDCSYFILNSSSILLLACCPLSL